MPEIRDTDGNVVSRSRNLRGIRTYVSKTTNLISVLSIDRLAHDEGKLMILFSNGDSYETNFASFDVLKGFVRRWRNVYGAPLRVNGYVSACVSKDNPRLL